MHLQKATIDNFSVFCEYTAVDVYRSLFEGVLESQVAVTLKTFFVFSEPR